MAALHDQGGTHQLEAKTLEESKNSCPAIIFASLFLVAGASVARHHRRSRKGIDMKRTIRMLGLANDKVITIGSDAAAVRFRSATSSIRAGGENLIFQHYLTVYRDRIVSIRLAQTEPSTAGSEIAFQRFLLEFSQKLTALKTVRNVHHTRK